MSYRIRDDFSQAAAYYEAHARMQRDICAQTAQVAAMYLAKVPAPVVLDLGCGSGALAAYVQRCGLDWQVVQVDSAWGMCRLAAMQGAPVACMDALQLALRDGSVDGVFSSLMLQWVADLPQVFAQIQRCVRLGGFVAITTFGSDTLRELVEAYAQVGLKAPVNDFVPADVVRAYAQRAGLVCVEHERFMVEEQHGDARALMRHLKATGARSKARAGAPISRALLAQILAYYDAQYALADGQGVRASYEVLRFVFRRV